MDKPSLTRPQAQATVCPDAPAKASAPMPSGTPQALPEGLRVLARLLGRQAAQAWVKGEIGPHPTKPEVST